MPIITGPATITQINNIPFKYQSYVGNTGYFSITILNKPSNGWSNGNILIACVSYQIGPVAAPIGWKNINETLNNGISQTMYHICSNNEPTSYYFISNSPNDNISVGIIEYSGQNIFPINNSITNQASNNTPVLSSITTTTSNNIIIAVVTDNSNGNNDTITIPTGFTSRGSVLPIISSTTGGYGSYVWMYDAIQSGTGTYGGQILTGTTNGSGLNWGTQYIALSHA